MSEYTKEFIQEKLRTDYRWIKRGLIVIYEHQTKDEQRVGGTMESNGVGFSGCDGGTLSYCARWVLSGRELSGKHLDKVKKKLPKYWKQILKLIKEKES